MINVIASIKVKPSGLDEFLQIFKSNIANVLNEEGCIEYLPTIDYESGWDQQSLEPAVVTIVEKWQTFKHLQAHATSAHMLEYRKNSAHLVESVALKILQPA